MDEFEFLYDWQKHEDNLLVNRGNFFMVAQSMLFAATSQLLDKNHTASFSVLCSFGFVLSGFWWFANYFQISQTLTKVKDELEKNDRYKKVFSERYSGLFGPTKLLGYLLPLVTGVFWIVYWNKAF